MLPLNYVASTNTLYLAFGERVDHAALYAIEKILDCRTQPCVAGRKRIARQLEAMRQVPRPGDVEFGPMNNLSEMARIASSYTARLNPEKVRLSRIGRFIWLRLEIRSNVRTQVPGRSPSPRTWSFALPTDSTRSFSFIRSFPPTSPTVELTANSLRDRRQVIRRAKLGSAPNLTLF